MNGSTLYVADGYGGLVILTIPDAEPPEVFITNPTFSPTYTSASGSVNLGGGASDNVGVTCITWSSGRGGGGQADGTESWFVGGIALQPGTNVLTVAAFDAAGNSGSDTLTVIYQTPKQDQTITFPALANRTFGDAPVPLAAAASSGLPVSFSVVSGPATLTNLVGTRSTASQAHSEIAHNGTQWNASLPDEWRLMLTGAGSVTVRTSQQGNDFFNPAPPVDISFAVTKAEQAIAFAVLPDRSAGDSNAAESAAISGVSGRSTSWLVRAAWSQVRVGLPKSSLP